MHGMTENDSAMYFKNPAWHGLGNVVESDVSTSEALVESGLNWDVCTRKLFTSGMKEAEGYMGVQRCDTGIVFFQQT